MIDPTLSLETSKVILRPLAVDDFQPMLDLAKTDDAMWEYFSLNLGNPIQLRKWFEMAFVEKAANTRRPFAIIDKQTNAIAGSSSMGNIAFPDLRLEIGWSWLAPAFRSSGINKHAKWAMMRYAFETLQFERVEFKTDVLNTRARKGLAGVGGIEEGILRSHMNMWNNRRRTSIFYSVLRAEWPGLQQTIFKDFS